VLDSGLAPGCWASAQGGGVQVYLPTWLFSSNLFVPTTVTREARRNEVLVGERRVPERRNSEVGACLLASSSEVLSIARTPAGSCGNYAESAGNCWAPA